MERRILWVIGELNDRLNSVQVADLPARVNLSPSRFAHLFKTETGCTPTQYVHALRMERARVLLARTFLTVKQVMAQVGISDASHFSKNFRRYHGISPSDARRAPRGEQQSDFMTAHFARIDRAASAAAACANE